MNTFNATPLVQAHAQTEAHNKVKFHRILVQFASEARHTTVSLSPATYALMQKFARDGKNDVNAALRKAAARMQKPAFGEGSRAVRTKAIAMLRGNYHPVSNLNQDAATRLAEANNAIWSANC